MRSPWSRFLQQLPLISFCSLALLGGCATPGLSLEQINLKPSFLLEKPLPFKDLENFALGKGKSADMQFLLDLIVGSSSLKEADLKRFLGDASEVNGPFIDRFLHSAIGEVLLEELMRVMQDPVEPGSWQAMRDAMVKATADNKSSVIEVLQDYEPKTLTLDVSRVGKLQGRVQKEVEAMQNALGISQSGSFNGGVTELFCKKSEGLESVSIGNSNIKAKALFDLLFAFTASGGKDISEAFDEVIPIDPKLAKLFLDSYFGEIFLRHLDLSIQPQDTELKGVPALKQAIENAVKDEKFSINKSLDLYQPDHRDEYRSRLTVTITRIRDDIRDYQKILGVEGTEDINTVIRTIVCEKNSPKPQSTPTSDPPSKPATPSRPPTRRSR